MKNIFIAALLTLSANGAMSSAANLQSETVNAENRDANANNFLYSDYPTDRDYGRGRTVRWFQAGAFQLPKLIEREFSVDINGNYVNEVYFRAEGNTVNIRSVEIQLSNGQVLSGRRLSGTLREGQRYGFRLDRQNSLAVERIIIRANSPNLLGSRGSLQVAIGLAY